MAVAQKRSTLVLWKDVIFALFVRKLASKFNDKLGLSWLVLQPASFILAMSFLRGKFDGDVHGIPTFIFMLLGLTTVFQFLGAWSSVSSAIQRDKPLYAFRQVMPIASIVTESLLELITNIAVMSVLLIAAYYVGITPEVADPIWALIYLFEIQLMAYSLGVVFSLLKAFVGEMAKVESIVQRPTLFISGAFFSLNDFPADAWKYFDWNPLLVGLELARNACYPAYINPPVIDSNYFHLCVLILLFLALSMYIVLWKKAISR